MWQASLISAGLGFLSARKQRKQARRQAEQDRLYQQEQNEILETEKQAYRDITLTNPYADMQNSFGGLQTDFSNLAAGAQNVFAGAENKFAGLENQYEGMENRFEDMTVDMRAADFQAQQGQQQRANILQGLRGAAGTSGIAGLAQSLANQGALQSQQISAGIGQQERQNQMLAAQEGSRIDMTQRGASMQLQQLQAQGAMQTQQMQMQGAAQQQAMQIAGAQRAQALGVSRENLIAQGAQQTDMAIRGGDAMLQQAEMSRQATLLGMQMGQASGANQQMQMSLYNQQQANASAGQMMTGAFSSLASGLTGAYDAGMFGGGGGTSTFGTGGFSGGGTPFGGNDPFNTRSSSLFNTFTPVKL